VHVGLVYVMSGLIAGLVLRDKTGLRYEDIKESPETSHQACQSSLSLSLSLSLFVFPTASQYTECSAFDVSNSGAHWSQYRDRWTFAPTPAMHLLPPVTSRRNHHRSYLHLVRTYYYTVSI